MADNGRPRAIDALLCCSTVRAAAAKAGLGERTIYRYLADSDFRAELHRRQDEALSAVTAALAGGMGSAVQALAGVLDDPECPQAVKVRAALGWLREGRAMVETDNLVDRVATLEKVLLEAG